MHLSGYEQPKGKIFYKDGKTFLDGDDGYIYEYVYTHNGLSEIGFFKKLFKKVTKLVGKVVKVVAPVARFIPALAPFAMPLSAASITQSYFKQKADARKMATSQAEADRQTAQLQAEAKAFDDAFQKAKTEHEKKLVEEKLKAGGFGNMSKDNKNLLLIGGIGLIAILALKKGRK